MSFAINTYAKTPGGRGPSLRTPSPLRTSFFFRKKATNRMRFLRVTKSSFCALTKSGATAANVFFSLRRARGSDPLNWGWGEAARRKELDRTGTTGLTSAPLASPGPPLTEASRPRAIPGETLSNIVQVAST